MKHLIVIGALSLPLLAQSPPEIEPAEGYAIRTVAGIVPALEAEPVATARVGVIGGIASDSAGNVYLTDTTFSRVLKVTTDGIVIRLAGNGENGVAGDGKPAIEAAAGEAGPIAVGADGTVYFASTLQHAVRAISPDGTMRLVVGPGPTGMGPACGEGGPADRACLSTPSGLAASPDGTVYVAEKYGRILKITPEGVLVRVAGDPQRQSFEGDGGPALNARFKNITSITLDLEGKLYIADYGNRRVRVIGVDGIIRSLPPGPLLAARLAWGGGKLFLAPGGAPGVWQFTSDGVYEQVLQSGPAPSEIGVDATGALLLAAFDRLYRQDCSDCLTPVAGVGQFRGDGGPAESAWLSFPGAVFRDAQDGAMYVLDSGNGRLRRWGADGIIETVADLRPWPGCSRAVAAPSGGAFITCQAKLLKWRPEEGVVELAGSDIGGSYDLEHAPLETIIVPYGLVAEADGGVLFADGFRTQLLRFGTDGRLSPVSGNGALPADGAPLANTMLQRPEELAMNTEGVLYVTSGSGMIYRVGLNGKVQQLKIDGLWGGIQAGPEGVLFLSDKLGNRVIRRSADGELRRVAGNGEWGFSGDGGSAPDARLRGPARLFLDSDGAIWLPDTNNHRIRKVEPVQPPAAGALAQR
ncbi:MAG: hypothetical protein HZB13_19345 [Acidobacteria bacterium]|nr:hypothetical protein [Acidobacteriota bacterium]